MVRRPDPVPCGACAVGEFDMCRKGRYTRRGIKEIDGFGAERWTIEPEYAVSVDAALGWRRRLLHRGVAPAGRSLTVDAGAINREVVLENDAVVGSVNANLRHYRQGAEALAAADQQWLRRLITRTATLDAFDDVLEPRPDDVKTVICFGEVDG